MEDNTTPTGLPFSNPATSMKGVHGGHIVHSHQRSIDGSNSNWSNSSAIDDSNAQGSSMSESATLDSSAHPNLVPTNNSSTSSTLAASGSSAGQAGIVTTASSSNNTAAPTRPPNPRTQSSSSITSNRSAGSSSTTNTTKLNSKGHSANAMNASPAGSVASMGLKGMHEDEIEASLRQWRNHVFPSLKAGNYISPGQETPDKDPIHPLIEPILPSIFTSPNSNNLKCIPVVYENGKQFLDAIIEASTGSTISISSSSNEENSEDTKEDQSGVNESQEEQQEEEEEGEDYQSNWRLEMVLGQTRDLIQTNENAEGVWIALWSGEQATKTRLLEFCLMKLPSRPLVLSSPIPISLLPTALLQDRMQTLLNAFLSLPSSKNNPSPFSLVMGPTRVVEAFLLHYDSHPGVLTTANNSITGTTSSSITSSSTYGQSYPTGNSVEGMFEQSVLKNDNSPYPLKLSHPKYTAASMKAASSASIAPSAAVSNTSSSSTILTKPGSPPSSKELSSGLEIASPKLIREEQEQRARSDSTASLSIPSTSQHGRATHSQQPQSDAIGTHGPDDALALKQSTSSSSLQNNGHMMKSYQNPNVSQQSQQRQIFLHSAAAGRTVKPLLHTRAKDIPPAVSLSEGFAVRLAEEKDDLRTLVSLFQAYSQTLDHTLEENAARRALQKAMANKSVWIYHIYSQSLPGLSLIAGFLTTERKRPYVGKSARPKSEGGKGKGSVAITAVFTDEVYRSRGVAESLIRTSTRYYLVDLNFDYISVYIDPRNETISRVFSRVGYGILDRKVNEEIPIRLIRNALFVQWDEEKIRYQNMLNNMSIDSESTSQGVDQQNQEKKTDNSNNIEAGDDQKGAMAEASNSLNPLTAARNTLSLLTAANEEVSQHTAEISPTTSTGNAESGNLIPTEEENEAALQAENGKPLCTSSEEWQVVSLRSREVALIESRSRVRGHSRRDDSKRLSSEGPWH